MSLRVLRKLQGQKDVLCGSDDQQSEEDGDDLNPFDLLSDADSDVKEDDNETEHASAAAKPPAGDTDASKKKKKRKRKKKTKYSGNHISSEDNELTDNHIDLLIGKVVAVTGENPKLATNQPRIQIDKTLLAVEMRNLKAQNELRRTFGKRVVKIENKRGRRKLTVKTTYMVTPKDTWPPFVKNIITMKPVALNNGNEASSSSSSCDITCGSPMEQGQWFTFKHSQYYQSVQRLFLQALDRTDSDYLLNLVRRCPYHVDSLIQLSELCKMTDDFTLAGELIERALFVLEASLHVTFSLTSGNCRLDYKRQENRAFFIVLFKQAQYLEMRACSRTALEMSKLILSLNPDVDPLAMVLVMDYYAIRSLQYTWLVRYYEEYEAVRNLSQLPNMAYSYALALFCLDGEYEKSDTALQYALLMFPGVLRPLLEELSVHVDRRVIASSYFNSGISGSQSPALHQLVCLYVCRAKVIWRQDNIVKWLERNVNSVLVQIERKDAIITEYNQKRAARYMVAPRPVLRHVVLADFKEKVPLATFLTKEKEPLVMYDPLPPLDTFNFYEKKTSPTGTSAAVSMFFQSMLPTFNNLVGEQAGGANAALADAAAADPGEALPEPANYVNVAVQATDQDDDEVAEVDRQLHVLNLNLEHAAVEAAAAGTEAGTSYVELTESLTNIVDAMRDFLQNFRIGEQLPLQDGDDNGSSEDTSDYYD